ncbi:MAG: 3-hydroxyacyl-ACP dehydratase FabZ [Oligoflexia bacterium]|nr:3-hydroxyacyl-ACP dehydratase FabZ [Oligoflexia bacterium]
MQKQIEIEGIMSILPHRYPFILVDRVTKLDPPPHAASWVGRKGESIKNVTINENFFTGHFPHRPIMPGVLIIEAMAQTAAIVGNRPAKPGEVQDVLIAGIDNARFRKPVIPGDQLKIKVEITKDRGSIFQMHCEAFVDEELVAEADLLAKSQPKQVKS